MSENPFAITLLNDFIFCPASIYFHMMDADTEQITYESQKQLQGKAAHKAVDEANYSTSRDILTGISIYSEEFGFYGKIDIYDIKAKALTERKLFISNLYDGQVFQLYAQYFCMVEMGYDVETLKIHSLRDNKSYNIPLPIYDSVMYQRFIDTVKKIREFNLNDFSQPSKKKCLNCVYEPMCAFAEGGFNDAECT